jgi:hypothetical protein
MLVIFKEKVKYFSRPASHVFSVDASQAEEFANSAPFVLVQQTDPG